MAACNLVKLKTKSGPVWIDPACVQLIGQGPNVGSCMVQVGTVMMQLMVSPSEAFATLAGTTDEDEAAIAGRIGRSDGGVILPGGGGAA